MSPTIFITTALLMFGTILIIFGMKFGSDVLTARSRAQSEAGYRELAERAATAQSKAAASLAAIEADLASVLARLTSVEKILKDVG